MVKNIIGENGYRVVSLMAALTLSTGVSVAMPAVVGAITSSTESVFNVRVDAAKIDILRINDTDVRDGVAVGDTTNPKNSIHFKVDSDAYAKIVIGDKVLWQGDVKAGQPVDAQIDLGNTAAGVYDFAIRAYKDKNNTSSYSQQFFRLNYKPIIPSIIPDDTGKVINKNLNPKAPNTGLYVTIGGHIYSMTTVAFLAILVAVAVYLIANKFSEKKVAVTAKTSKSTKTKATRKKMDLI